MTRSHRHRVSSRVLHLGLALTLALPVLSTVSAPAQARGGIGATLGNGTVDAYADVHRGRGGGKPGRKRKPAPSGPRLQYVTLPDCGGNEPSAATAVDCLAARTGCPTGQLRVRVFEASLGTPLAGAGWRRTQTRCLPETEAHLGQVVMPQLSARELRKLPIPAGTWAAEPAGGYGLVRMPTNVYSTTPDDLTLRTTMIGLPLVIRVHPEQFAWNFGDGSAVTSTGNPGGPAPDLTNAHTYQSPGRYSVVLTTTYSAEFSVNGGAFQPIEGTTEVVSPPTTLQILSGTARLQAPTSGAAAGSTDG